MPNLRPITQEDLDAYNRNMPPHLQAELSELEWTLVQLLTYPMAQRKPAQWKICDRNYSRKHGQWQIDCFNRTDKPGSNETTAASAPSQPARQEGCRYDEHGYRITSDAERDAYLNFVGRIG